MINIRRLAARSLATTVAAAALTGGIAFGTSATASAAPADCSYMGYGSYPDQLAIKFDSSEQALANAINTYRAQNGLAALRVSATLARPAMWASLDDAHRGFAPSNHVDSRGMGIAQRAQFCGGYTGSIGEINYWGSGGANGNYYGTWQAALAWWKQSPGHNALLLTPNLTTFNLSRAYNGVNAETGFWTVDFGTY